ncbi:MAG: DUF4125 family protein [Anaerovoracaceae bacterium]
MGLIREITDKDKLVNRIIELEQEMFQRVVNMGGRASCQDDRTTFYIMRYSQHSVFPEAFLRSYESDLLEAGLVNRNLISEKYAYMMETTDPIYYQEQLAPYLPKPSPQKLTLIEQMGSIMEVMYKEFAASYPKYAHRVRPMVTSGDEVNAKVYFACELMTYSLESLKAYGAALIAAYERGENLVKQIQQVTAGFYGYSSLEEAERNF